ncbi:P-loop containing nucleoside triphosphate hydrolase protein [Aaosphaeria arxii CBS 175.79]|uniref:P-loop containing nucleoside triphosphate hydrolase protein n=1 Tax=Aaosphaeria arxii CBS 175.79 TaxID=1450172 RepID=A0A6A5XKJ9_9PLEO|nr:P-loop containing nucleoside triphosphate hydrolase protein [Aaosphaeria arxii CBS 175.79]KAF2012834.1 P-loop containing nucleoside triphosphate hydrolase protein [Aaosphaeria arxii CBS 175.79]
MDQTPELLDRRQIELFDALEELKKLNVASDLIPQLVVIGDQSSGKSSVLEGLVRFHFPVSERRCTKFPVNLILKTSNEERGAARIRPVQGSERSPAEISKMQGFQKKLDLSSLSSRATLEKLMGEAEEALGIPNASEETGRQFAEEMLVIEKHGPNLPILSFIDLPGLFQGTISKADEGSRDAVERMVEKQVALKNNVVLLVISASSEVYNQTAVRKFQDILKKDATLGDRAIGVITKPDAAHDFEKAMLEYVKDGIDNVELKYGWYVVRNLNKDQRESSETLDKRDDRETTYFKEPMWQDIPGERKGIKNLRTAIKSVLWMCTQNALPQIIERVRERIAEIENEVEAEDKWRASDFSRRCYLNKIAREFAELTSQAVTGRYRNPPCDHLRKLGEPCIKCRPFFPEPRKGYNPNDPEGQKTKLCSNIRGLNALFSVTMREFGKTEIVKRVVGVASTAEDNDSLTSDSENGTSVNQDHGQARTVEESDNWIENPEIRLSVQQDNEQANRVKNDYNSIEGPGNGSSAHQDEYQADHFPPKDFVRDYYTWPMANVIAQSDYEKKVVEIIKRSRGATEPIGEVNSTVYRDLFLDQSLNWEGIATNHIRAVWGAANTFVDLALEHVCWDKKVLQLLRKEIIKANLDELEKKAYSALRDLLGCLSEGNAGFFDSFSAVFTVQRQASDIAERLDTYGWNDLETESKDDLVAMIRVALDHLIHSPLGFLSVEDRLKDLVLGKALSIAIPAIRSVGKNEDEKEIRAKILEFYPAAIQSQDAGRVTGIVEAYYKLTMLAFTGYVNALVVDKCILKQLETAVFGQAILDKVTQKKINKITAEDKSEVERRAQKKKDCDALEQLLEVLERNK